MHITEETVVKTYDKHIRGTISELLVSSYFVSKGYIVSKPINDFNEYDLIIDNGESIQRVQVKTIYWDTNKARNLCSCVTSHIRGDEHRYNKKYTKGSFDILCAIHKESSSIYVIPFDSVVGRRSITFYPDGKPDTVNNRFNDFEKYRKKF